MHMTREQLIAERQRLIAQLEEAQRIIQGLRAPPASPDPPRPSCAQGESVLEQGPKHLGDRPSCMQGEPSHGRLLEQASGMEADAILTAALDGFVVCDMHGRILHANRALGDMLGFDAAELPEMFIWDIDVTQSRSDMLHNSGQLAAAGGGLFETILRRKDGGFIDAEVSLITGASQSLLHQGDGCDPGA
jgi:PAS domain S-box-containing protein